MKHRAGIMKCQECNFTIDLKKMSRAQGRTVLSEHSRIYHPLRKPSVLNMKDAKKEFHGYLNRFKLGIGEGGRF